MTVLFLLKNTGMHERMGIMLLSAALKARGHSVGLLPTEDLNERGIIARVKAFNPMILAYSLMTGEHSYHLALNRAVRSRYNALSVFGGPHATCRPAIVEQEYVDAVCLGEGDIAFPALVDRVVRGQEIWDIPNFWFKGPDGRIVRNDLGPLVEDLDTLPFADRRLFNDADAALAAKGLRMFLAMRGCPYSCTYCFNHAYNQLNRGKGPLLRYRSVDNLIQEITKVRDDLLLEHVLIDDDTFLLKPKGWLEEFSERFAREVGLPISCNVRADLVNDTTVAALKRAGCQYVWMGVECGHERTASRVLQRGLTNERILAAARTMRRLHLPFFTQNLIGLPVDDPLTVDLATLDLNLRLKPDFAWSSLLYPYPNTEISRLALEIGMFHGDLERSPVSNKSRSALNFGDPGLARKIDNLHKLFGLIVQYPFLRRVTMLLIALPFRRFYLWLYFGFYGYRYVLAKTPWRNLRRTLRFYAVFFIKYVSRLEQRGKFSALPPSEPGRKER